MYFIVLNILTTIGFIFIFVVLAVGSYIGLVDREHDYPDPSGKPEAILISSIWIIMGIMILWGYWGGYLFGIPI